MVVLFIKFVGANWLSCIILDIQNFPREEELVKRAKALKVDAGTEPGADLGPVISKEVKIYFGLMCQQ